MGVPDLAPGRLRRRDSRPGCARPGGRERETVLVEDRWQDDMIMSLLEDEYRALAPAWAGE